MVFSSLKWDFEITNEFIVAKLLELCLAQSKKANFIKVKCERAYFVYGSGFRLIFFGLKCIGFSADGLMSRRAGEIRAGLGSM